MSTPPELRHTHTLTLPGGPLHFIQDPSLPSYLAGYHAPTMSVIYGGSPPVLHEQEALMRYGQRTVALQKGDALEIVAALGEVCDGWTNVPLDPELTEYIEKLLMSALLSEPVAPMRPDISEPLTEQAAFSPIMRSSGEETRAVQVTFELGRGSSPESMTRGGWRMTRQGIENSQGQLLFAKVEDNPGAAAPGRPEPAAPAQAGFLGRLRSAMTRR
ncbi:hypothetical protein [Deinococcus hopiensis]|uniref:Uncharacterized protein n=1 Tax=Deinococcus hopiensis KR-140 TaxID=695939 RepID=A0A1W1VK60_9DEIO|nr:hypothetical protein [Deinococcus hopiensis]SMB93673.1 hypothetical protein SAMN00790413_02070 [Deinococcus hopiensis KR-140]